ncbi:TauD/TfdA family dioxygenase [Streptomyces sp. M10(2022)]
MHHELTSASRYPQWIVFSCLKASASGGTVSVADAAKVLDSLPAGVTEPFEREGWQLVRNYDQLVGPPRATPSARPTRRPWTGTAVPMASSSSGSRAVPCRPVRHCRPWLSTH